ncbi:MAG: hypothetical protein NW207_05720 [Cytophagales bacterium]|nr:hypothetical protein [Cytophagales bacterium]
MTINIIKYTIILSSCIIFWSCSKQAKISNISYHRPLPYPESDLIAKFEWTASPSKYPGTGSDMHWWTWGVDDAIYVVDGDGQNFDKKSNYAHLLKVTGTPPEHKVEEVNDFTSVPFRKMLPKSLLRRYVNGTLAVDSNLYISLYDYDWNIDINKPYFDTIYRRIQEMDVWRNLKDTALANQLFFTDNLSKNYGIAGIIQSKDFGKTWTNIPNANTPPFLGPRFAGLMFLTFGPGYTQVPDYLGKYAYAVSNDGSWETGDNLYMARVHKDSIINRASWQFLSGIDGENKPVWSANEEQSYPIFTDTGHVAHPTMSYNKALNRYILGVYSDVVPHKENATRAEWKTWDKASEMQLYESEYPWGPWKVFYNEKPFGGNNHSAYLPQIPAKWWSADGLSGTVMFAGDYTGYAFEYYALMTWPFKLTLRDGKP